ncbi:unnamed protein product, partial [Allacma fusca]
EVINWVTVKTFGEKNIFLKACFDTLSSEDMNWARNIAQRYKRGHVKRKKNKIDVTKRNDLQLPEISNAFGWRAETIAYLIYCEWYWLNNDGSRKLLKLLTSICSSKEPFQNRNHNPFGDPKAVMKIFRFKYLLGEKKDAFWSRINRQAVPDGGINRLRVPKVNKCSFIEFVSNRLANFFKKNKYNMLDWPAQSPDLNPIEHLWDHIASKLKDSNNWKAYAEGTGDRDMVEYFTKCHPKPRGNHAPT